MREYDSDYPTVREDKKVEPMYRKPVAIRVGEIMSRSLILFKRDEPVVNAISALVKNKITGAPVVDENQGLVGIISEKDILKIAMNEAFFETPLGQIDDYMSKNVIFISSDCSLFEIASLFSKHKIRRLPVVDNNKVVGIVSCKDVLTRLLTVLDG